MMRKGMTAMLLLLMIGLTQPLFVEASTVTYVNRAEQFVFVPEDTNLFENFKGIMPGDERNQEIQVRNNSTGVVNIYLKINPINAKSKDFLEQLNLKINNQETVIFNDQFASQGSFSDYKLLTKLEPKAKMSLDLLLEVPISLSKEFMHQEAEIEWLFKVEEVETKQPTDPNNFPKTGSSTNTLYIVVGLLFILVGKTLYGERKNHHSGPKKNS